MLNNIDSGVWAKRQKIKLSFKKANTREVEDLLESKFNGGFPVLLSSGRGAIKLIVQEFWKDNNISVFQFASQCVVNAIQAASVIPYSRLDFTSEIIHHQWGYTDSIQGQKPFIEDSCDTFLAEGASVLRLGGRFEIWSLTKILNSRFGAIVWCRNSKDAQQLREIRDRTKKSNLFKKRIYRNLRGINSSCYRAWEKMEYKAFNLSKLECGLIKTDVLKWKEKYLARLNLAEKAYSLFENRYQKYFVLTKIINRKVNREIAPVVILLSSQETREEFPLEYLFQFMHKTESGKKPQKYLVYRFLKDKHLLWS